MSELRNYPNYIIVQAGGRGSRLEVLTANKPKALVPVDNLPMIFHLFKRFPNSKFKIIADYKKDVLKAYLKAFCTADYEILEPEEKGTCSGIRAALSSIPDNESFMLIWCDIILADVLYTDLNLAENYIGISKDFVCRWSFNNDKFQEVSSSSKGVAGLFIFSNKKEISDVPKEGEFVRYLSTKNIKFNELNLFGGREIGTMLSYFQNEINKAKCRPFNKMEFKGDIVLKYAINEQGKKLAQDEVLWYKEVKKYNYINIPKIYGYDPLVMEKINGQNIFEYAFLTKSFKKMLLDMIVGSLQELHTVCPPISAISSDCEINYITKTFDRLNVVKELVPFANDNVLKINGKNCQNIFYIKEKIEKELRNIFPKEFNFIHGDCTFHNMMIEISNSTVRPILIDPRGYFGNTKFYGDVNYDWAKLYYSLKGNYDQFNKKNFSLNIKENEVELEIVSNNWEDLEEYFFEITKTNKETIKLLHSIIWLSLTTYAWEDYDSICGAFYKGILELQDYLDSE